MAHHRDAQTIDLRRGLDRFHRHMARPDMVGRFAPPLHHLAQRTVGDGLARRVQEAQAIEMV
jgi:hypothetical protein